jgi:hypothetical protein
VTVTPETRSAAYGANDSSLAMIMRGKSSTMPVSSSQILDYNAAGRAAWPGCRVRLRLVVTESGVTVLDRSIARAGGPGVPAATVLR